MSLLSNTEVRKWYPVYTHPRAEKKAGEALANKGIETYLPLHRQLKQWSDRKKWVEEPLIKSYLFVNITEQQQTEVLMTKGVSRFIYFSSKITPMPDKQMADLKLLLASPFEFEITEENLEPGEKVMVKAGTLKGMIGEMVAYRSKNQLALRLDNLGCSIIVNIAASLVERF